MAGALRLCVLVAALAAPTCGARGASGQVAPTNDAVAAAAKSSGAVRAPPANAGCLPGGSGFLRARVRGAIVLDLNWNDAEMECAGGPRPDGSGLRVSIGGPPRGDGKRMRFVFGVSKAREGASGTALPTNITFILEGEQRLFATQGDSKCTIDSLRQERLPNLAAKTGDNRRSYRVTARGFCTGHAATLTRGERVLITSFDFVGRADYEDHSDAKPKSTGTTP
jgi:hypothetical protein